MPPAWDGHSCIRSTRRTTISPSFARCRTGSCAISSPALKASLRWVRSAVLVKQYQITVDPHRLHAYNLSISDVAMAVQRSNGEVGGRSVEMAEKEFILRVHGY